MNAPTEADIAAMPRLADAVLAKALHWAATEEERLYRECPTAFWLAPEANDIMTPPQAMTTATIEPTPEPSDEKVATGQGSAIGFASLVAGPVFLSTLSLVTEGNGTPIGRILSGVGLGLISAPLSMPVGAIAASMPVILGVALLSWLGLNHATARRRSLWAAVGAGMGLIIAAAFDAGMATIPLVLTAVACASVAHRAIHWTDVDFA